jgi:hypothetical protein
MPVVYVSVGRRLGFPIYLVETRGHLFFRWDDPKGTLIRWQNPDLVVQVPPDRFNVDGSGEGIAYHEDAFYEKWPEPWQEIHYHQGLLLRSMTAKEELAAFLIERGECSWDLGRPEDALKSYACSRQLVPDDERYHQLNTIRVQQYFEAREVAVLRRDRERSRLIHQHGPHCLCLECSQRRPPPWATEHMLGCECFECRKARSAQMPQGLPGHPSVCNCAGCRQVRQSHLRTDAFHRYP